MADIAAGGLSREAALRIALAARSLPDIVLAEFVGALADRLGLPLSTEKLGSVTVADLQQVLKGGGAEQAFERSALEQAVRCLRGEEGVEADEPQIATYVDGDMPESIRVAVASNSAENLDGHFGSCLRFLVYQVSRAEIRLIAARPTGQTDAAEDKNAARAELIGDCHVVCVQSIGGPAAAKVVRAGLHPLKFSEPRPARATLGKLQDALAVPPPWLAKIVGVAPATLARFAEGLDA
jgi:nitrogen fixation protein NifX